MLNNGEVTHLNALDFLQKEFVNPMMYIHALVTTVLERAWGCIKMWSVASGFEQPGPGYESYNWNEKKE